MSDFELNFENLPECFQVQDNIMINVKGDYWKQMASSMFNVPYEKVTPVQRNLAKKRGFINLYGGDLKSSF